MSRAWVKARKKDPYYRRAKDEGYPSRAAYKLLQVNDRFSIIRPGATVVDLGAAPGGWSQVALELVGPDGRVVAVDKIPMKPFDGMTFLRGDLRTEETLEALGETLPHGADVVISDMAPKLSGNKSLDHALSVELAEAALTAARRCLKRGGTFLVKLFQGDMYETFRRQVAREFRSCKGFSPKASPAKSSEIYIVATGWRGS